MAMTEIRLCAIAVSALFVLLVARMAIVFKTQTTWSHFELAQLAIEDKALLICLAVACCFLVRVILGNKQQARQKSEKLEKGNLFIDFTTNSEWSQPIPYADNFLESIRAVLGREEKDDDIFKTQTNEGMTMDAFANYAGEELKKLFPIVVLLNVDKQEGTGMLATAGAKKGWCCRRRKEKQTPRRGENPLRDGDLFGCQTKEGMKVFKVGDILASGADGAYKCQDICTKESYCVKVYDVENKRKLSNELLNELRAKKEIQDHKNVVKMLDVIEGKTDIYVMMELIPGQDLVGRINELANKRVMGMEEEEAALISYQACDALKYCHDKGLVHADVKPENIMLKKDPRFVDKPIVKLIDFGFACMPSGDQKKAYACDDLTPPYRDAFGKPEENTATKEMDCFRVGCLIYIMLMFARDEKMIKTCIQLEGDAPLQRYQNLSSDAKELITKFCARKECRLSMADALQTTWLTNAKERNPWLDEVQ